MDRNAKSYEMGECWRAAKNDEWTEEKRKKMTTKDDKTVKRKKEWLPLLQLHFKAKTSNVVGALTERRTAMAQRDEAMKANWLKWSEEKRTEKRSKRANEWTMQLKMSLQFRLESFFIFPLSTCATLNVCKTRVCREFKLTDIDVWSWCHRMRRSKWIQIDRLQLSTRDQFSSHFLHFNWT